MTNRKLLEEFLQEIEEQLLFEKQLNNDAVQLLSWSRKRVQEILREGDFPPAIVPDVPSEDTHDCPNCGAPCPGYWGAVCGGCDAY